MADKIESLLRRIAERALKIPLNKWGLKRVNVYKQHAPFENPSINVPIDDQRPWGIEIFTPIDRYRISFSDLSEEVEHSTEGMRSYRTNQYCVFSIKKKKELFAQRYFYYDNLKEDKLFMKIYHLSEEIVKRTLKAECEAEDRKECKMEERKSRSLKLLATLMK